MDFFTDGLRRGAQLLVTGDAEVSVDGHTLGELKPGASLVIEAAADRITLIHPPGYDYYEILRSKLHWGRDSRRQIDEGNS